MSNWRQNINNNNKLLRSVLALGTALTFLSTVYLRKKLISTTSTTTKKTTSSRRNQNQNQNHQNHEILDANRSRDEAKR